LISDLKKQFELNSEQQLNEFGMERAKMESQLKELKSLVDELRRQLHAEVENSKEKNSELTALNKQKFKLLAQV
jgi:uncharacterized coiled-coil DUF342 family protein